MQSNERGEAGPEAEFVPLTPLNSARDLMGLVLRCDNVRLDIADNPAQESLQRVVNVLRQAEQYLPNTPRTSWDTLNNWRSSVVDRLEGLSVLENILTELTGADMHILVGEYVAFMSPEEAHAAAQDFVDAMEFTGLQGSDFDPRKRVGLLHVVNITPASQSEGRRPRYRKPRSPPRGRTDERRRRHPLLSTD